MADDDRSALRADCTRCFGLCCVVPAFSASADFAITKPAGQACPNLGVDSRCTIHATLRERGFAGCTVYDCFGAGQHVSQVAFGGRSWRQDARTAQEMFAVFPVVRQLHELLWYLTEALELDCPSALTQDLRRARDQTRRLADLGPPGLLALDVASHRDAVNRLLLGASESARADLRHPTKDHRGADLIGAGLRGADLRGATLRGAYLIGADLRGADLRRADVIGADLRGADLRGADLRGALFLIQSQLDAARGDRSTGLPASVVHPAHWPPTG